MRSNIYRGLSLVCMVLFVQFSFAQNKRAVEKANQFYSDYAYVEATKIYEKIADKGYVNQDILQKLGNSYFFRADYKSALKWYGQLFNKLKQGELKKISPEYYYRYALCLKSEEKYDESNEIMNRFVELVGKKSKRAELFEKNRDYLEEIKKNSGRGDITTTGVNTKYSEYAPIFYIDHIVFTANRKPGLFGRVSEWTNEGMYNIYIAPREGDSISNEVKINPNINTPLNESTATFTKDGNVVYFTRNDLNAQEGSKKDNTILLKIYKGERDENGNWVNIKELPFSSSAYSIAHPALSPDEKYLYFASNMKGTYGESDIFRVEIKSDGTYGKPENLGENINTEYRETFPFITEDNVLYFASDGFPGLGGLDVFASQLLEDGKPGPSQNAGRPINSPYDDFTFILDSKSKIGYFASNRPGGKGSDDIYCFNEKIPLILKCSKAIKGIVKDSITGEVLEGVSVRLEDKLYNNKGEIITTENGTFAFDQGLVFCEDGYANLRVSIDGYDVKETQVVFEDTKELYKEVLLTPLKRKITKGDDLAEVFDIKDIYFDYGKSDITPQAEVQLSQIVEVMTERPEMELEVRSHTDSRGSKRFNYSLSNKRAKATIDWIVSQGISSERIYGKGYGEEMLLNRCADGVECTEEEHAENRRSEFIINKM